MKTNLYQVQYIFHKWQAEVPCYYKSLFTLFLVGIFSFANQSFAQQSFAQTQNGNQTPSCEITGTTTVCPGSSNVYTGKPIPSGYTYKWTITGSGIISGSATGKSVTVIAANICNKDFTVTLAIKSGSTTKSGCSKYVSIKDYTKPVIYSPVPITAECDGNVPAPDPSKVTASDNCGKVTVTWLGDIALGSCPKIITRTYKATDACGNYTICAQIITVKDKTKPVISCPAIMVECDGNVPAPDITKVTASDNCGKVTVKWISDVSSGTCPKTITRTYKATDGCGNYNTCTQVITVKDITKPTVTTPQGGNKDLGCNPDVNSLNNNFTAPTFIDNCGLKQVTSLDQDGGQGCTKTRTRTWTAEDNCGNKTLVSQALTWKEDHDAPVLSGCPADATYQCYADVPVPAEVMAADDCDVDVQISFNETQSNSATGCSLIRTWTANDACGNTASCTQTITIDDNIAPILSGCPADATYACIDDVPAPAEVTATDNCGNITPTFTETQSDPGYSCGNVITRIWTATDHCNTVTCTQTIFVKDDISPEVTCPPDITIECGESIHPNDTGYPVTVDNCSDGYHLDIFHDDRFERNESDCQVGTVYIDRTWRVYDFCGSRGGCEQIITINQATAPSSLSTQEVSTSPGKGGDKVNLKAYPNPYSSEVNFSFVAPVSGKAILEIYNLLGQKLAVVFNGNIEAGIQHTFKYPVPAANRVQLVYKLTINGQTFRGMLIPLK